MKKLLLLLLLNPVLNVQANDGSFYSSGSTLLPLKETTIRMKKEILNLRRDGMFMQVDIYFEFFNPGPEKELTVGFVTPPAEGDVRDDEREHPQIENFMVMVNDRLLEFKIKKMENSGFKLADTIASGDEFVYYFNCKFKSGITIIRHSYKYRGGGSVEATSEFLYRLTTGTGWAGGSIEDFELNIMMEPEDFFEVPASFNKSITPWIISGIGRISNVMNSVYEELDPGTKIRMVYMRKGVLQTRMKNFKPTNDLSITNYLPYVEVNVWTNKREQNDFMDFNDLTNPDSTSIVISRFTDEQLRLYKNLEYARNGYDFKDPWLKEKFSKYTWYIPDPAMKAEVLSEYYLSKELILLIANEERKRKKP